MQRRIEQLVAFVAGHDLPQRHARQQRGEFIEHLRRSPARTPRAVARSRAAWRASPDASARASGDHVRAIDGAQHAAGARLVDLAAAEGDELVEQRQRVAHAAVRGLRDQANGGRLGGDLLRLEHLARCSLISAIGRRLRLNCRQRDSTVTGSFCGSVVASRNFTCGGGSSSVLSSALNECVDSMCTSSTR